MTCQGLRRVRGLRVRAGLPLGQPLAVREHYLGRHRRAAIGATALCARDLDDDRVDPLVLALDHLHARARTDLQAPPRVGDRTLHWQRAEEPIPVGTSGRSVCLASRRSWAPACEVSLL